MIHPDTELRFIDQRIGMGVVATRRLPKGTITWVRDQLDLTLSPAEVAALPATHLPFFHKYAYRTGTGDYVLCWDHGRFVNHSCEPSCMAAGFDFEVAVRDIEAGEQLTGDYSAYNLESGFECHCGSPRCRHRVEPSDASRLVTRWDRQLGEAFACLSPQQEQLWPLVREKAEVEAVLAGRAELPSCRLHLLHADDGDLPAA